MLQGSLIPHSVVCGCGTRCGSSCLLSSRCLADCLSSPSTLHKAGNFPVNLPPWALSSFLSTCFFFFFCPSVIHFDLIHFYFSPPSLFHFSPGAPSPTISKRVCYLFHLNTGALQCMLLTVINFSSDSITKQSAALVSAWAQMQAIALIFPRLLYRETFCSRFDAIMSITADMW